MRRRSRFNSTGFKIRIGALAIIAIFGGVFLIQLLGKDNDSGALSATEFKAGRIIDDSVFYNPNTMTAAEIDAFIDSHTSACDTWGTQKIGNTRFYGVQASNNTTRAEYMKYMRNAGYTQYHDAPFICIRDYYENPSTHKTNFETGGKVEPGMISAGQIIYNAAHEYNVNPQVLLVMLKKESYAWGDDWPLKFEYNTVMGYGCPDNAACDQDYFGFYNQVMTAAWQLNYYREHPNDYRYRPGRNVNIYYSPDYSCGTKSVYIENYATAGLYIYTPYTPNDAALANYPGTAWCGSYGNRNFYMYFREWFGSTLGTPKEEAYFPDGDYYIVSAQSPNEALQPEDGNSEKAAKYTLKQRNLNDSSIFRLERQSDGNYSFINKSNGLALDVYGGKLSAGSTISQWEAHRGTSQRFKIIDNKDGTYSLSVFSNSSMVVSYDDKEDTLSLSWFGENAGQKYRLISTKISSLEGTHRVISTANRDFAVDVYGGAISKDGANINSWEQNPSEGQSFSFVYDSTTNYYRIQPSYSSKYSIDVIGGGNKKDTNIGLWGNNDGCAQKWEPRFYDNSEEISLINACSGLTLDLHGGIAKNGANISTWNYEGNIAQRWILLDPIKKNDGDPYSGIYTFTANAEKPYFSSTPISHIKISQDSISRLYKVEINNSGQFLAATSSGAIKLISSTGSSYYSNLWNVSGDIANLSFVNAGTGASLVFDTKNVLSLGDSSSQNKYFKLTKTSLPSYGYTGDGYYTIQSALNEDYYLGIMNDTKKKGDNISLVPSDKALVVYIRKSGNSYIIEDESRTRRLDMEGGTSYNGANVGVWDDNGGHCNQKWIINQSDTGSSKILESCRQRALEIYGGIAAKGTNIGIWDSHIGVNQSWLLIKKNSSD